MSVPTSFPEALDILRSTVDRNPWLGPIRKVRSVSHWGRKWSRRGRKWLRFATFHYFLDAERVLARRFEQRFPTLRTGSHGRYGNYFLDPDVPIEKEAVVYSFGVGRDISFDLAVAEAHGCRVFLFDPTPSSVAYMKQWEEHSLLVFEAVGIWIEDKTLTFRVPPHGGSASAIGGYDWGDAFPAPCKKLSTIIADHNHSHIDVLKMDVEGAALPVLEQLAEEMQLRPSQIVVELERPRGDVVAVSEYFVRVDALLRSLSDYSVSVIPRSRAKYYSVELLLVKRDTLSEAIGAQPSSRR